MQWNPDVATQLIVASDEDSSPSLKVIYTYVLIQLIVTNVTSQRLLDLYLLVIASVNFQMWDMRNVMTPVKEFVGHTKGML